MKRAIAVLVVLVAVMAVQGAPENEEATGLKDSECFECHQAGGDGDGPIMQEVFRMFLSPTVFTDDPDALDRGRSLDLTFDIRNWWTAELQGFEGFLDLSEAPALSFEAAKDPVSGSREGTLPAYQPAEYYQGTARQGQVQTDIPAGGTDLVFTMAPEDGDDADLLLRIWGPGADPETDPPLLEVDDAGDGQPETATIAGDPVQGGTYTVEAEEEPDSFDTGTDQFDPVGFTVDWTLSFEFESGDPVRTGASLTVLDGQDDDAPQSTAISWPVNVVQNITSEQRIRVYMETVAFYDHPPQFRAVDEWLYWTDVVYIITPDEAGNLEVQRITPDGNRVTEYVVGDEVQAVPPTIEEEPDLTDEKDPPLDIAAEVIGYMAGFLLIISLVSGGALGNWSRRLQDWLVHGRSRKRVAFHNLVGYGLMVLATAHMVLFLVEPKYPWTVGFFLGGVSIFGMYLSGVTGIFQRPMVRAMDHETWRWLHYLAFVLAFSGALGHILLDGIHFTEFQQALGWEDPVAPALEQIIPVGESFSDPATAGNTTADD